MANTSTCQGWGAPQLRRDRSFTTLPDLTLGIYLFGCAAVSFTINH